MFPNNHFKIHTSCTTLVKTNIVLIPNFITKTSSNIPLLPNVNLDSGEYLLRI